MTHLASYPCRVCGLPSLAVPERAADALCGPHMAEAVGLGVGGVTALNVGKPGPVVARWAVEPGVAELAEWAETAHPAAEWTSRQGAGGEPEGWVTPRAVARLTGLAREAGWGVVATYARGRGVHGSTGQPTALRHSIAVHLGPCAGTEVRAVAVYGRPVKGSGAWTWGSVWLWGPALPHFGLCSLAELEDWLRARGQVGEPWYADVRARVAGVADAKAVREARGRRIKAEYAQRVEARLARMGAEEAAREAVELLARREGMSVEDVQRIVKPARARKDHGN